ncbi:MAG TPA: dihydropteroate synthase [Thermoanaerobaculia bacterium]|nr:dihydropteroate synthase [Thermoanaerobaculia bacterium]
MGATALKRDLSQPRPGLRLPRGRSLSFDATPLVMGIVNVTPDSFSDGSVHFDREVAIAAALQMIADGADIVDVGGESTRPDAQPVPADVELDRVLPVIRGIRRQSDVAISIDTMKASVASEAIAAGADIVNEVSALRMDPHMAETVAKHGVPVVLMHMRGEPRTMQQNTDYEDLLGEIMQHLRERKSFAEGAGVDARQILIDPGIGFGKSFDQNLEILHRAAELSSIAPVVIGASRKAFLGNITGQPGGASRMAGSLAAVAAAALAGAAMVRVHDVRPTVDFLRVFRAIEAAPAR